MQLHSLRSTVSPNNSAHTHEWVLNTAGQRSQALPLQIQWHNDLRTGSTVMIIGIFQHQNSTKSFCLFDWRCFLSMQSRFARLFNWKRVLRVAGRISLAGGAVAGISTGTNGYCIEYWNFNHLSKNRS